MTFQRRELSWAVTGDVGERGPAINLFLLRWRHNIQPKIFFNTVNRTGPCLGEHGPAAKSIVFENLHTMQPKNYFNTVKWAGPCLGEHEQPFIWTLLKICITSRRNDSSTPRNQLSRVLEEHGPALRSNVFEKLHTIQTKNFFNTETALDRVSESTTSRSFERCWKSAQH